MKLQARTFQIFWDVHAWTGIVGALLLHVMFFTGAFALFYRELNVWASPAHPMRDVTGEQHLAPLLDQLAREEKVVGKDRVAFMPEGTGLRAYWSQGETSRTFVLSAATGRLEPAGSELGTFLYSMHYLGPLPMGIYVAGAAALAMLLALVTGFLLHVKDLFRQWFVFRPERVRRTWSSDMHKVLGVFGLPYQVLYAWSGAVLCLSWVTVQPAFRAAVFRGDALAAAVARGEGTGAERTPTGRLTGGLPDLDGILAKARTQVPGIRPTWIGIEHPGDQASTVTVSGDFAGISFGAANVVFRASDSAVLHSHGPGEATSYQRFEAWFFGLHYATFAGYGIKGIYAFLALATCAVILTGNLVWLDRRDRRRARPGNRILERLTVSVGAGVIVATAGLFLTNRLLSGALSSGAAIEQGAFWSTWAVAAAVPLGWRQSRKSAGWLLLTAACLFVLAVAVDVATRPRDSAAPHHLAIDVVLVLAGGVCGASGRQLLRVRGQHGQVGRNPMKEGKHP